jgi:hypothetical protein
VAFGALEQIMHVVHGSIRDNVTGGAHREFAIASGEMSPAEFLAFIVAWMKAAIHYLVDGGLFGTFIDWRGLPPCGGDAARPSSNQSDRLGQKQRRHGQLVPVAA